jgi:hypothetical protein
MTVPIVLEDLARSVSRASIGTQSNLVLAAPGEVEHDSEKPKLVARVRI